MRRGLSEIIRLRWFCGLSNWDDGKVTGSDYGGWLQ